MRHRDEITCIHSLAQIPWSMQVRQSNAKQSHYESLGHRVIVYPSRREYAKFLLQPVQNDIIFAEHEA